MKSNSYDPHHKSLPRFDRRFFNGDSSFTFMGSGSIGGKAVGLARAKGIIESSIGRKYNPDISIDIPTLTVISTEYFDFFMKQNDLYEIAYSDLPDDQIAGAFLKADLPVQVIGDLRALINQTRTPLAIRSSSMLEDAMFEPFASVYETKMIPNNQPETDYRFKRLAEAIKYIYASTFFRTAKNYMKATHHHTMDEKMAVIIQEVVGIRYDNRFYPNISGVAKSYNFYPAGNADPRDGVIDLAFGLGKTIVDEGKSWSYSPSSPKADPPYNSIDDLLDNSQRNFWAVNMGEPKSYNPISETEYLSRCDLSDGEYDGALKFIASTYSPQSDRIEMGLGSKGPRLVNFGPILKLRDIPLNDLLGDLLKTFEDAFGTQVEIEFAVNLDRNNGVPARFGFLQVRPMVVSLDQVNLSPDELTSPNAIVASESVLGNGILDNIKDIVYIKPESFDTLKTIDIASQMAEFNSTLVDEKRPYLLIGFGRWGTSDPQAGIPVKFDQIAGARIIVESTLPNVDFPISQGSHFFHNITSFRIFYFSVKHSGPFNINWDWLKTVDAVRETEFIRHVRLQKPLLAKVDGINSRGVIKYER